MVQNCPNSGEPVTGQSRAQPRRERAGEGVETRRAAPKARTRYGEGIVQTTNAPTRSTARGAAAKAVVGTKTLGPKGLCRFDPGRPHHIVEDFSFVAIENRTREELPVTPALITWTRIPAQACPSTKRVRNFGVSMSGKQAIQVQPMENFWDSLSQDEEILPKQIIKELADVRWAPPLIKSIHENGGVTQANKDRLFELRFGYALHRGRRRHPSVRNQW